jgi:hypothetical protein
MYIEINHFKSLVLFHAIHFKYGQETTDQFKNFWKVISVKLNHVNMFFHIQSGHIIQIQENP